MENKDTQLAIIDSKTIKDFLFSSQTKLSESQQNMFMQLAIRNQLDPFKRDIYAIAYGNDFNIVTGYQVYIQRADSTGNLDGWECTALRGNKNELTGARITIYRKDFAHPFMWEVSLSEFDKGQSSWKKMPEFMIKKVCIGQGFRLAFPNELGGMPYLQEELEGLQPNNEQQKPPLIQPGKKSEKQEPKTTDDNTISEAQRKRLYAIYKNAGKTDDEVKEYLFMNYDIEHSKDIPRDKYEEICEWAAEAESKKEQERQPGEEG